MTRRETPLDPATIVRSLSEHEVDYPTPPGAAPYGQVRERALEVTIAGTTVAFAVLDDLISMKRAAGRPIDTGDIAALVEIDEGG
ncbi:MAG: hypothetical protein H0V29_07080 [Thermoleophilaceae bacterium]|nr:hypothetical protein [Thermoleophilaceae bacterium]